MAKSHKKPNIHCPYCGNKWHTRGVFKTVTCSKCKRTIKIKENSI